MQMNSVILGDFLFIYSIKKENKKKEFCLYENNRIFIEVISIFADVTQICFILVGFRYYYAFIPCLGGCTACIHVRTNVHRECVEA